MFEVYGPLGVIAAVLMVWAYKSTSSMLIQLQLKDTWTREVLVGLVRDQGAVLVQVRDALNNAPCGDASNGRASGVQHVPRG